MHRVIRSIRRIPVAELPVVRVLETGAFRSATSEELLHLGIVHLTQNLYSCNIQEQSDDRRAAETGEREWLPVGDAHPGEQLTKGTTKDRYGRLPTEIRAQVLRALVYRAADAKSGTAKELVTASLTEQSAAIGQYVGPVGDAPLVDLSTPDAERDEAQRLAADPDNGIVLTQVAMAAIDPAGDVVEAQNLIPHVWGGEHPIL